jgi:hypothetical protein
MQIKTFRTNGALSYEIVCDLCHNAIDPTQGVAVFASPSGWGAKETVHMLHAKCANKDHEVHTLLKAPYQTRPLKEVISALGLKGALQEESQRLEARFKDVSGQIRAMKHGLHRVRLLYQGNRRQRNR